MAQIKIYGLETSLNKHASALSDAIHSAIVEAFEYPEEKRFHRFIRLQKESFIYPTDRSDLYTVIEISIFEGRSKEAKKQLIQLIFKRIAERTGIKGQDIEITIFETPRSNWGIRGMTADELALDYKVNV